MDAELAGRRVLVVDAYTPTREELAGAIERLGAEVARARDSEEAIRLATATAFDAAVLDLEDAVHEDPQLCQLLRALPQSTGTRIELIIGVTDLRGPRAAVDWILTKPVHGDDLAKALLAAFG
ncbi:MAG: hypothetical protein MJE66_04720 [Proteobacteria bacterium]|nr:hypothetical protein [Pseudomonadota bacterium]